MTLKARIIVRFKGLKKSRIAISILDFLSTLKRTSISAFVLLLFINGIIPFIKTKGLTYINTKTKANHTKIDNIHNT